MGQKSPNAYAYADPYAHADPNSNADPYAHADPGDCFSFCWCDGVGISDGQRYYHSFPA
jgi:hypothetical protein